MSIHKVKTPHRFLLILKDIVDGNKKVIIMIIWRLISSGIAKQTESDATATTSEAKPSAAATDSITTI